MNNLNPELFLVFFPPLSAMLFALGGTEISKTIKGKKWIRRFVLPFILGFACLITTDFVVWRCLIVSIISTGAFALGYGQSKPYWYKATVALAYACISLSIGVSVWNLFTFGGFLGLFWLSNNNVTKNIFVHKVFEIIVGGMVGMQIAFLLSGNGVCW